MSDIFSSSEQFWDNILSRDPARIQEAFRSLDISSRQAVLKHLQSMAKEDGWLSEQRLSAKIALDAIQSRK